MTSFLTNKYSQAFQPRAISREIKAYLTIEFNISQPIKNYCLKLEDHCIWWRFPDKNADLWSRQKTWDVYQVKYFNLNGKIPAHIENKCTVGYLLGWEETDPEGSFSMLGKKVTKFQLFH